MFGERWFGRSWFPLRWFGVGGEGVPPTLPADYTYRVRTSVGQPDPELTVVTPFPAVIRRGLAKSWDLLLIDSTSALLSTPAGTFQGKVWGGYDRQTPLAILQTAPITNGVRVLLTTTESQKLEPGLHRVLIEWSPSSAPSEFQELASFELRVSPRHG